MLDDLSSQLRPLPWGLKLPRLNDISLPAFSNSFSRALEYGRGKPHWKWAIDSGNIEMKRHVDLISTHVLNFNFSSINLNLPSQKENCNTVYSNLFESILTTLKTQGNFELYSFLVSVKNLYRDNEERNWWLNFFKVRSIFSDLKFSLKSFCDSIKFRLLIPAKQFGDFSCACKSPDSPNGVILSNWNNIFHCLSCGSVSKITIERHKKNVRLLDSFVTKYIPLAATEIEYMYRCSLNGCDHHVDLRIELPASNGQLKRVFYVDVSVFNVGCPSYRCNSEDQATKKFKDQESAKRKQYTAVFFHDSDFLIPFIVDTIGNIGPSALAFVELLGHNSVRLLKKKIICGLFNASRSRCIKPYRNKVFNFLILSLRKLPNWMKKYNSFLYDVSLVLNLPLFV